MYKMVAALMVLSLWSAGSAETIALSGKVANASGKPIAGAVILLTGKNLKDTTDATGSFAIEKGVYVTNPARIMPGIESITLKNGTVLLNLLKASQVKIDFFDLQGNLLDRTINNAATAGEYRFNVMNHPLASKMMVIQVSIGTQTSTFRHIPLANGTLSITSSANGASGNAAFAKVAAVVDSLKVTAAHYKTATKTISTYEEKVDIALDTNPVEYFSFFVTSLKGLRILSKSDKGFGGDFRMGKTGQGAGLLGADSICQCLAEMGMAGSKTKQWRAFLSAKKGPDGKQVNAIDRIGQGPWYDRFGRLVSNNITDLLAARPASADPEIKNDLPNEYGIPNHKPDGKVVDNHLTITGSDSTGKLYTYETSQKTPTMGFGSEPITATTDLTCEDWTSTTVKGRPRAGFSWPQASMGGGMMGGMSMKNWISVWDMAGCEAGLDSTDASGAGKPNVYTIGNGGGYGGFYCFALNP